MTHDEIIARVLQFDNAAYEAAQHRMKHAPIELTEHDFQALAQVSAGTERDGREALRQAQLALVSSACAAQQTLMTKTAKPQTMEAFLEKYGAKTVTYRALNRLLDDCLQSAYDVLKQHKEKIDELQRKNAALQDRVLELEATRAVAHESR
jgi:hypothetical protein